MGPSALGSRLTDQEKHELTLYCVDRLRDLRQARDTSFEHLKRYAFMLASFFDYRLKPEIAPEETKTIFDKKNASTQVVRSIYRFLLARLNKDLFGSEDWFEVKAAACGSMDQAQISPELLQMVQDHSQCKLTECLWKEMGREGLAIALAYGFFVCKTAWEDRWDISEEVQTLLTGTNGQPVTAQDGTFFSPDDELAEASPDDEMAEGEMPQGPEMGEEMGEPEEEEQMGQQPSPDDESAETTPDDEAAEGENVGQPMTSAQPTAPEPPTPVYAKDPTQEAPSKANGRAFKPHLVENMVKLGSGLNVQPVHWQDAVWPINATRMSLDDPACDFISHTRPMTIEQLRSTYDPDGENLEVQAILQRIAPKISEAQSENSKPKRELAEAPVPNTDLLNPPVKVTECYFRKRIPSLTGQRAGESRIFLCLIEGQGVNEAIWMEYLARMSPMSEAPLHLVPLNKIPGRAHGMGVFQAYEMASELIDALVNGVLVRNEEHCNAIKIVDESKLQPGQTGEEVKMGPGRWLKVKASGIPINQIFQYAELPDLDQRTWQLLELFMQLIQTESGVTNASQGELSNLPSNGTATGVNSLLESSSVLHNYSLEELRSGLRAPLRYGVRSLYFHQDSDEAYEGARPGVMMLSDAQSLKSLPLHVEIVLTRAKKQDEKDAAMQAIPLGQQFYAMPPAMQQKLKPLFVQAFRANGIDNAESFFPSDEDLALAVQQQQAMAALPAPGQAPTTAGSDQDQAGGRVFPAADDQDAGQRQTLPLNVVQPQFAA